MGTKLTTIHGDVFTVDLKFAEALKQERWTLVYQAVSSCVPLPRTVKRAIQCTSGKWRAVGLHRIVMLLAGRDIAGRVVDHRDGDVTNNVVTNLRICTSGQNRSNTRANKSSKTGYKGVSKYTRSKSLGLRQKRVDRREDRWVAYITHGGKRKYLGVHYNILDAARAYDRAAIILHGEFANTNFPKADYT